MTASLGNTSNPPIATGVDPYVNPPFINAMRAPTTQDIYNPGTNWQNSAAIPRVIYETTGGGLWYQTSGSSGLQTLSDTASDIISPISGNIQITGDETNNIVTTTAAGQLLIGLANNPVVLGTLEVGGIISADSGLNLEPMIVTAGASPQACNNRVGIVTFSGVSIAATATQSLVITNIFVTTSTRVLVTMVGATSGSALTIQNVASTANTITITVTNGTGAATNTANLTFTFILLN